MRRMPHLPKMTRPAQAALAAVLLAGLWLAGLYGFTRSIFNDAQAAQHANLRTGAGPLPAKDMLDAIVVLTGGSNRLQVGFDLLAQSRGKKLFISGVYQGVEVRELLSQWKSERNKSDLDCCVALGFEADDTAGNADETAAWMTAEEYKSFYLVTAHYHMKRALLEMQRAAPHLKIRPWPVVPEGLDINNWWRSSQSRNLIIREYSKYLAALVITSARRMF
ncbi:MAG TPA: YdcF family protein [Alphaproteobacteria bacterium]|nr:YdcF family protein [Alphaproteobacteria bacterium]